MRLLAFVAILAFVRSSDACQICLPVPKKSAAQHLLAADVVAFAREDPDKPFHFRTTEVLRGKLESPALDLFCDSSTRRILRVAPKKVVVVARAKSGDWTRLGIADREYAALVREILEKGPAWTERQRVQRYAKLLGHKNREIARIAHLEVARAPYAEIRRLKGALSRGEIHAFLRDFQYFEWHALYILLLAQSDDARDRKFIKDSFRNAPELQLAAWATAWIEIEGKTAIAAIGTDPRSDPGSLRALVAALSVQGGGGRAGLQDGVVEAYRVLLGRHPALASVILDDLIAWERRDLVPYMRALARRNGRSLTPDARLKLRRYFALPDSG